MDYPIVLDQESSVPIFLQISRAFKANIVAGVFTKGTKLPSAQSLAKNLKIARTTVVKAYLDLAGQGYIETVPGGGTFVSGRALKVAELNNLNNVELPLDSERISEYTRQFIQSIQSKAVAVEDDKQNYGASSIDFLPLKIWKNILLKECRDFDVQSSDWAPEPFGLYRCRAAIADFLCRSKGLHCSAEQVMIFAGCKESFYFMAKLLLDPGDAVAMENPSYSDPQEYFKMNGIESIPVDIDEDGIDISALIESGRKVKMIYTSNNQHPTGTVMSIERRKKLVEWSQSNDISVWEEGWDSDYNYSPPFAPALQGYDQGKNVFFNYTFWKILYPLVTIGVLVVPPNMVALFEKAKKFEDIQFSVLEQRALTVFIEEGHLERHIKKTKSIFERRRKAMLQSLLDSFLGTIDIPKQSAALHLCIRFGELYDPQKLLEAAEFAKLYFVSTAPYYMRNARKNEFLVSFALHNEEIIEKRVRMFARHLMGT